MSYANSSEIATEKEYLKYMKTYINCSTIFDGEQASIRKWYISDLDSLPVLCPRPPIPCRRMFCGSSAILSIQKRLTKSGLQTLALYFPGDALCLLCYMAAGRWHSQVISCLHHAAVKSFVPEQYSHASVPEGTMHIWNSRMQERWDNM